MFSFQKIDDYINYLRRKWAQRWAVFPPGPPSFFNLPQYNYIKKKNCFAYNSATKYRSEAVLYSKWTAGYPLSHHVKIIEYKTASERYLVTELWAEQFWVFFHKLKVWIFSKTPKIVWLISKQPNIVQTPFCIQNERQDILYHLIW